MRPTNKTIISGNLVDDPKIFPFGEKEGVNFTIAHNESYYSKKEEKYIETVSFIPCTSYTDVKNIVKHLKKGKSITVTGRLKQERWEKDGKKESKIYILVEEAEYPYIKSPDNDNSPDDDWS